MIEINCPACAGPQALGGDCATCGGTMMVSQEIYDDFMLNKERQEATYRLQAAISQLPVENIPGEQQSIVVITLENNAIGAMVDGVSMAWDDSASKWVAL